MLTITLRKPVEQGERRPLTPTECNEIVRQGTSVQPRYGKRWQVCRDDDGALQLLYVSNKGGATWAIEETPSTPAQEILDIQILLSSPIAVGEKRGPTVFELGEIFNSGVSVLPGCQLVRESSKRLMLICGRDKWLVQEIPSENVGMPVSFLSLKTQHRGILAAIF